MVVAGANNFIFPPGPTTVDKSLKHIKVYPKLLSLLWATVAGRAGVRVEGGKAFYYNKCSDWKRSCRPWKALKGLLICRFMFTSPPSTIPPSSSLAISILSLVAHEKGLEIISTRGEKPCLHYLVTILLFKFFSFSRPANHYSYN